MSSRFWVYKVQGKKRSLGLKLYECIEKYQFELYSKYDREHGFDVILG